MVQFYENIHGYLAVTICVLGTIFNIVNILVLSHKVQILTAAIDRHWVADLVFVTVVRCLMCLLRRY